MFNFEIFSKKENLNYHKGNVNKEIRDMVNIHRGGEILA